MSIILPLVYSVSIYHDHISTFYNVGDNESFSWDCFNIRYYPSGSAPVYLKSVH